MPNKTIDELTAATGANLSDEFEIWDPTQPAGSRSLKATSQQLLSLFHANDYKSFRTIDADFSISPDIDFNNIIYCTNASNNPISLFIWDNGGGSTALGWQTTLIASDGDVTVSNFGAPTVILLTPPGQTLTLKKDNIASILKIAETGGNNYYLVSGVNEDYWRAPLADVSALKGVDYNKVSESTLIMVNSLNKVFYWNPASLETDDDVHVVRPTGITLIEPGRWLELGYHASIQPQIVDALELRGTFAAGNGGVRMNGVFYPSAINSHDLGLPGLPWRFFYCEDGNFTNEVGAATALVDVVKNRTQNGELILTTDSNAAIRPARDVIPYTDNLHLLGSSSFRWSDVYATRFHASVGINLPDGNGGEDILNVYTFETHSTSFTGAFSSGSIPILCVRVGRMVTLSFPAIEGTLSGGGGTLVSSIPLPTWLRPAYFSFFPARVKESGTLLTEMGGIDISTNGSINIYKTPSGGGFTNAGICGLSATAVSYVTIT